MARQVEDHRQKLPGVTVGEVNRVLAVGRLLLSVLTPEELNHLQNTLTEEKTLCDGTGWVWQEKGNAGVP